jgi:hypothetical protein
VALKRQEGTGKGVFMMMENCERHDRIIDDVLKKIMGGKVEYGFKENERKMENTRVCF